MTTSESVLFKKLAGSSREYVDLLDDLNANGLQNEIPTPKIVVVGVQSSGKSSTLESISGMELPKGTGTVTKAALEMRLRAPRKGEEESVKIWVNENTEEVFPTGVPRHTKPMQVLESEIASVIEDLTTKLVVAQDCGFTKHAIVVQRIAKGLPNLTLVDLPGIIRVGGKEKELVMNMIIGYLKQPEVIMLPVVPCNVDIDTSECLQLAQKYNKEGVVVLTKVDLIDKGGEKEWVEVLESGYEKCPNIKDWIMVKNRSQAQVDQKTSIKQVHTQEMQFFEETTPWSSVDQKCFGVDILCTKLASIQVERIKDFLPTIKIEIAKKLKASKIALESLGQSTPSEKGEKIGFAFKLAEEFSEEIRRVLDENTEKFWAKLHAIYEKMRANVHATQYQISNEPYMAELKQKIIEHRGPELKFFPSYNLAKFEIKRIVDQWKNPGEEMVDEICEAIQGKLLEHICAIFGRYPAFASQLRERMLRLVEEKKEEMLSKIMESLNMISAIPYTQNDYYADTFISMMFDIFSPEEDIQQFKKQFTNSTDRYYGSAIHRHFNTFINTIKTNFNKEFEAGQLASLIRSYWKVAYKRFADEAAIETLSKMVDQLKRDIKHSANETVISNISDMEGLLQHDAQTTAKRKRLTKTITCLQSCMEILTKKMF